MNTLVTRLSKQQALLAIATAVLVGFAPAARAAIVSYTANLDGPSESPPNASPGIGLAVVDVDASANTMHVHVNFTGLVGTTTASHIHAPTLVALTGTAGVATTTPYFAGFPIGVTSGTYDNTLDMTLASSYNSSFVTSSGGTVPLAEAALFAAIAAGKAYLNVHSNVYPGGEIRGFLVPENATPVPPSSWGRIKKLYR
jgi:CHRD domain